MLLKALTRGVRVKRVREESTCPKPLFVNGPFEAVLQGGAIQMGLASDSKAHWVPRTR